MSTSAADLIERSRRTGTNHDWDLHRALGARGWYAGGWPTEYGGRGDEGAFEILILSDELERRGIPFDGLGMTMLVANTILRAGSEEMKRTVLPRALAGEIVMCLGYTESHGGSDVAAARTTAVRDGDHWVINGHKMFTTLAHESEYVFLLTRTSPGGRSTGGSPCFWCRCTPRGRDPADLDHRGCADQCHLLHRCGSSGHGPGRRDR